MADDVELWTAWTNHVGRGPEALDELEQVLGRYREATRRYHGLRHVTWVVRHVLDLARAEVVDRLGTGKVEHVTDDPGDVAQTVVAPCRLPVPAQHLLELVEGGRVASHVVRPRRPQLGVVGHRPILAPSASARLARWPC